MQDLIAKAATLLEALPYIQKFAGETFVVKYGGSFMDSPDAAIRNGVARDIVFLEAVEINPVVVHGDGHFPPAHRRGAGVEARRRGGQGDDSQSGQRVGRLALHHRRREHAHRVESSQDLQTWTDRGPATPTTPGHYEFTDNAAPLTHRFYRAVRP